MVTKREMIELQGSDEWKIVESKIDERVETLTNNLLQFGADHATICFTQGKVASLRELQKWVAKEATVETESSSEEVTDE